jgi:cytochrome b pre-mRNA-processing protein 3
MVVLHAYLVLRRFRALGEAGRETGQRLFDILFDDMDQTLREIGVGDLSVGKKIRTMASAFYGRVAAYDEGLAAADASMLADAIRRNVFADGETASGHAEALAAYVRRADEALAAQPDDALTAGEISFAAAPASTGEKP